MTNFPFINIWLVQMISSLTFKQENTITDEPVVDLLSFLNKKLDAAVANARLSSGQNPLQQLVLIIGDGRLHEKVPLHLAESKKKKGIISYSFSSFFFFFSNPS